MNNTGWLIPGFGYLLGSLLPADYVVRRIKGTSPADRGENFGTAATWRLAGPLPALVVLAYDLFKGFLPVFLAVHFSAPPQVVVVSAAAPVLGHNWPIQRGFQGGRGMAASIGALLYLVPTAFIPAFAAGGLVALYKGRTPWVAIVGLPLGLILALYLHLPGYKLAAILVLGVLLLLRQFQWGDWS